MTVKMMSYHEPDEGFIEKFDMQMVRNLTAKANNDVANDH